MAVPAFLALFLSGQIPFKVDAKDGCNVGSTSLVASKLCILLLKDEQCEKPKVCPPADLETHCLSIIN